MKRLTCTPTKQLRNGTALQGLQTATVNPQCGHAN